MKSDFMRIAIPVVVISMFIKFIWIAGREQLFKQCAQDKILVVYSKIRNVKVLKYVRSGRVLVLPYIQDYSYMDSIEVFANVMEENILTHDSLVISSVWVDAKVMMVENEENIEKAVHMLFNKSYPDICDMVEKIIRKQIPPAVASFTREKHIQKTI
ncbi:MAG: hypothetical protein II847_01895 [Ruminobacter sp.]|uniref:SPFH domain / Band 7 family protein n=1 Tax=Ruminobacter amylophilus TaxID=867 RepID=A0A662ZHG2_9GAMM|nr:MULTISPECIES: hypothetical protein [Ruminobacter]MBQ3774866.1 hypothetical protein [Ruminobacter sp.]SFP40978.1 hypothetical protein SAMN02910344_01313 [Ruminobacter amylophilus]